MAVDFLKYIDNSWTLFLDRDGVINKRIFGGYVTSPDYFEFLPGVLESINFFSKIFNRIIVITNQQGVGKGIMTEIELNVVHDYMISEISTFGGRVDSIYYCTDLAHSVDNCRKPSIKMAQIALENFPEIDLNKSIMIGDSLSDIEFGKNAGMKTVFVSNIPSLEKDSTSADIKVECLLDFKTLIENI
ncbi:MAG: HAD family hydrolase [Bacteroidetes bacterium]|nr:HAD family hydrolase [Bacteroidota bacterium]